MLKVLQSPVTRVVTWLALLGSVVLWALFVSQWGDTLLPEREFLPYRLDFDVYRTGAQVFADGGSLYDGLLELERGSTLPFTYPPIAAVLFTVFIPLPLWMGSTLFTFASMGCLWWIGRTTERRTPIARLLPQGVTSREVTLVVMIAFTMALWFAPMRETFIFGQVNIVLAALVLADVSRQRPRWWTGALLGLAIAIKLTPVVFLLFLFLRADWRSMLRTAGSFLLFTGLGHLLMPTASRRYWTEVLVDTRRIGNPAFPTNQSINGALARLGLEGTALTVAWFVVALAAGLTIAWVAWRLLRHGHAFVAAVVVGFAALLCSPVSWDHHWVWSWPLITLMALWALKLRSFGVWAVLAATGTYVFMARLHWRLPREEKVAPDWEWYHHLIGNSFLLWSLVAVIMLGILAPRIPGASEFRSPVWLSRKPGEAAEGGGQRAGDHHDEVGSPEFERERAGGQREQTGVERDRLAVAEGVHHREGRQ